MHSGSKKQSEKRAALFAAGDVKRWVASYWGEDRTRMRWCL